MQKPTEARLRPVFETNKNDKADQMIIAVPKNDARRLVLIANGIFYKSDENLNSIYRDISTALGYHNPPSAIVTRFSMSKFTQDVVDRRPIKIEFRTIAEREEFEKRYCATTEATNATKKLTLSCLQGFKGYNNPINIRPLLDPATYNLHREAVKLKTAMRLNEVTIIDQQVFVRHSSAGVLSRVLSINDLQKLASAQCWLISLIYQYATRKHDNHDFQLSLLSTSIMSLARLESLNKDKNFIEL